MSEKWEITESGSVVIRQSSSVDFRNLNKVLYQWATENDYVFNESFTEKAKTHGKEFEIHWRMERRVTSFIKFNISVFIWAYNMNPAKEPEKMQGEIEIVFDSNMEMDWQNRWEFSTLHKFLRYVYIYYIKKQYFLNYAGKCWEEVYGLHAAIKTHLDQLSLF